ncbi:MAG: hypothetical protein HUU20_20170 [Pirellulales bacterium]|nr:hypothetical protein [Pirellulales bacterium]
MKRVLIVTFAVVLTVATVGCECCRGAFRGSRMFTPQPAAVYDTCDPCATACDPCGTAAPATIMPGPETYAPTTVVPIQ